MLTIVKIGGNIIDNPEQLNSFLKDFAVVQGSKILVHGGGKIATAIGDKLGIQANYVDGRRITDAETLKLVTMVYGGLVNKDIVAQLQANGCNAIGITGADGNMIKANKRTIVNIDYGFVGDVDAAGVNTTLLSSLLSAGLNPVVAPLTHDGNGSMLNTNADTIAQELAKAMSGIMEVQLIYTFEKNGVLQDREDDNSVIKEIQTNELDGLINNGVIHDGMIPKLQNACSAIRSGVSHVIIGNAKHLADLVEHKAGTRIL